MTGFPVLARIVRGCDIVCFESCCCCCCCFVQLFSERSESRGGLQMKPMRNASGWFIHPQRIVDKRSCVGYHRSRDCDSSPVCCKCAAVRDRGLFYLLDGLLVRQRPLFFFSFFFFFFFAEMQKSVDLICSVSSYLRVQPRERYRCCGFFCSFVQTCLDLVQCCSE